MKTATLILALCAAAQLPGCAWLKMAPPAAGESPGATLFGLARNDWAAEAEEVQTLLAYYQRMLGVSADDLRKEFTAVTQVFNRDKTENARLKLVLLLSLPGAAFRDDGRLMSLLEAAPSRNAPAESPRRQLLTLLARLSAERQRQVGVAREEQKKQDAQVKDEQRRADDLQKRADEQQKRADEQQKRADEQQKRADELQQKLDKLLAIERELRRAPRRLPPH